MPLSGRTLQVVLAASISGGKNKVFALLKSHAKLVVVLASLLAAGSLFLIHFLPRQAIYLWSFGAAMILVAFIMAVFQLLFHGQEA